MYRVLSDHENSDVRSDQDHYLEKWSKIRSDRILKKWTDLIWSDLIWKFQIILRKLIMEKIRNFYIFAGEKFPTILHIFGSALILGSKNVIFRVKIAKKFCTQEIWKKCTLYPKRAFFLPQNHDLKISDHFRSDHP